MATTEQRTHVIAARDRGPGPAKYRLPSAMGFQSHDLTKRLSPAYSFGTRSGIDLFKKDASPGPQYFIDPKCTRRGKDGVPAYSMLGRHNLNTNQKVPGPGQYSPEKNKPPNERTAPKYSMAGRTRFRKSDSIPAPNSYTLPTTLGSRIVSKRSSAAHSMAGRGKAGGFSEDLAKAPGPGKYDPIALDVNNRKAPSYSIQGRPQNHSSASMPGPGAHSPDKVTITRKKAPSFSMGIRHSEFATPLIVEITD
ncbi:Outer dense fiber protein 3 [Trichoplax sp. H2]|uniref:Outer dense fiber protein 3 n=1 Tax=Trichoplax adhaerens TaxID=10228 RepID=B3RSS7_TRIAD|nr:expressed hypothetical protein [Trichoplax adhaerens]EDV27098.1 expressed hypothetical protein [Trichoplax adhaerens]RDD37342.1 Outer dense fiber protein 3 [Trichoplax sp. H2]|eukprot:XP_002111094.1 expressed hypothetical protein [Trichoplax adhaerens]